MSFAKKALALGFGGLMLSATATAALAQTGGADVPTDAKKEGTKENGASSTGMKKEGSMEKGGSMEKDGSMEKKSGDKM